MLKKILLHNILKNKLYYIAVFLIISLGILIRTTNFMQGSSLWLDETWVASMITERSLHGIFSGDVVFDMNSNRPPVGFEFAVKLFTYILGEGERALRCFPFIASIFSIIFFFKIIDKSLNKLVILYMSCDFIFLDSMIRYSTTLKQYSSDVLSYLILFVATMGMMNGNISRKSISIIGLCGFCVIFLSYTSVFILPGIGISMLIVWFEKKNPSQLRYIIGMFIIWLITFVLFYFSYLLDISTAKDLSNMWSQGFLPKNVNYQDTIIWIISAFLSFFDNVMNSSVSIFTLILFVFGISYSFVKKKVFFVLTVTPFILAIVAAAKNIYPFDGRTILFLIPPAILLTGEGVNLISNSLSRYRTIIISIVIVILLYNPMFTTLNHLKNSYSREGNNRKLMQMLSDNIEEGDLIVMNLQSSFIYRYYTPQTQLFRTFNFDKTQNIYYNNTLLISDRYQGSGKNKNIPSYIIQKTYDSNGLVNPVIKRYNNTISAFTTTTLERLTKVRRMWVLLSHMTPEAEKETLKIFNAMRCKKYSDISDTTKLYLYVKKGLCN